MMQTNVDIIHEMAYAEGIEAGELVVAMRKGNQFLVVAIDEEENNFMLCHFHVNADGKSGDFGGAPDSVYPSEELAVIAMVKLYEKI